MNTPMITHWIQKILLSIKLNQKVSYKIYRQYAQHQSSQEEVLRTKKRQRRGSTLRWL